MTFLASLASLAPQHAALHLLSLSSHHDWRRRLPDLALRRNVARARAGEET